MDATNFCLNHPCMFLKPYLGKEMKLYAVGMALDCESDLYSRFLIGFKDTCFIFTLSLLGDLFILLVKENICL